MSRESTVAALSSGLVPSGVAVIRVSGPEARFALETLCGSVPSARAASLRELSDPITGTVLDQALVLFFPSPHSFTGEDVAELHCHGSRAVVDGLLNALWSIDGIGPAEAGDFTRQAFANGKMDLVQVEALGDLIHASTAGQRDLALFQMSGEASRKLMSWRERLAYSRAMIEAELDFSDEDDVPGSVLDSLPEQLNRLLSEMHDDLQDKFAERLRDGFRVVLAGAPNAGKSTLMNALLQRDAVLVSPIAGTTRDRIDAVVDLDGLPVILSDTAGLRSAAGTSDPIETLGIDRAREAVAEADCVVWLEGGDADEGDKAPSGSIRIRSKKDTLSGSQQSEPGDVLMVSGKTGEGLEALKALIHSELLEGYQSKGGKDRVVGETISINARRQAAVNGAVEAISQALAGFDVPEPALDFIAEDLRRAQAALASVTGDVDAEGVLDVIFSSFCIGK